MVPKGFNPIEKYESTWMISPLKSEHKKCLKFHHLGLDEPFLRKIDEYIGLIPQIIGLLRGGLQGEGFP